MPIAIKSEKLRISSEKKTEELAKKFTKKLKPGHVVFIYGEIGVGKTTFVRYLINQFQKITKKKFTIKIKNKRKGDMEKIISSSYKLKKLTGWRPRYNSLPLMVKSSINWEKKI